MKSSLILSKQEKRYCTQLSLGDVAPHNRRAQAILLVIDQGLTQSKAGELAGLTVGQVRYCLQRFRTVKMDMFPPQPEATVPTSDPDSASKSEIKEDKESTQPEKTKEKQNSEQKDRETQKPAKKKKDKPKKDKKAKKDKSKKGKKKNKGKSKNAKQKKKDRSKKSKNKKKK